MKHRPIDIFTDVVAVLSLFVMVYFVALLGHVLVEDIVVIRDAPAAPISLRQDHDRQ